MCDLLWECGCDHIGLSDETNAKQIFDNAHYICNKLLDDYLIIEKSKEEWRNGMTDKQLLEDIRHELVSLTGLKAFDMCTDGTKKLTVVWNRDLIELNYEDLIERIDKELEQ